MINDYPEYSPFIFPNYFNIMRIPIRFFEYTIWKFNSTPNPVNRNIALLKNIVSMN